MIQKKYNIATVNWKSSTILFIIILCSTVFSQEHESEHKNRLGLEVAGTFIPTGSSDENCEDCSDNKEGILVPTIGLEYVRSISDVWAIGGLVEVELDHYIILDEDLNRHNALIIAAFALFKILPQWYISAGGGIELEAHKNLAVIRLGTGYEIHLSNGWDIAPVFAFYHKIEFNSFSLGLSIGKSF